MLLKHFGSVKKMKEASLDDFKEAGMPENIAKQITDYLKEENGN